MLVVHARCLVHKQPTRSNAPFSSLSDSDCVMRRIAELNLFFQPLCAGLRGRMFFHSASLRLTSTTPTVAAALAAHRVPSIEDSDSAGQLHTFRSAPSLEHVSARSLSAALPPAQQAHTYPFSALGVIGIPRSPKDRIRLLIGGLALERDNQSVAYCLLAVGIDKVLGLCF